MPNKYTAPDFNKNHSPVLTATRLPKSFISMLVGEMKKVGGKHVLQMPNLLKSVFVRIAITL